MELIRGICLQWLSALIVLSSHSLFAQFTLENWASGGSDISTTVRNMAQSADGHIYVIGTFTNNTFSLSDTTIQSTYTSAIYLAKLDASLTALWMQRIAESSSAVLKGCIAVDNEGNIIIGLGFENDLFLFDDSVMIPGERGVELMKLDPAGNKLWAYSVDHESLGNQGVAVDLQNNILVAGQSNNDATLNKYDTFGSLIWSRTGGSPSGYDDSFQVLVDSESSVYMTGLLESNSGIYFDELNLEMPLNAYFASFVTKYDANGTIQWVRYVYSQTFATFAIITGLCILENGSVVIGGGYNDTVLRFSNGDSSIGSNQSNSSAGFKATYNSDGERLWANKLHTNINGNDGFARLAGNGNTIYLANQFDGTIMNDTETFIAEDTDILLERYDQSGALVSALQVG